PHTGQPSVRAIVYEQTRPRVWTDPKTGACHAWTQRVLVVQSPKQQQSQQQHWEAKLARLQGLLAQLRLPPQHGRKRYTQEADLRAFVLAQIQRLGLSDLVQVDICPQTLPEGRLR